MMGSREPDAPYANVSQTVVSSYLRQLPEFLPVLPEGLSAGERRELRGSQKELHAFFRALYQTAFDHPESFGLPLTEDVCMDEGTGKEAKQDVSRKIKKARDKMEHAIGFLQMIGQRGVLAGRRLHVGAQDYDPFFAKSPRVTQKLVNGMYAAGLATDEWDDVIKVGNIEYPGMMLALKAVAGACAQRDDARLSRFLFARCDFRALDGDYQPLVRELLRTATSRAESECVAQLHLAMVEMGYIPNLEIFGVHSWRVQYQGRRAIKASPLLKFEYDDRQQRALVTWVECASTNRLVPLLPQQPVSLRRDFFRRPNDCGASECSWCKSRKALGPSVLELDGDKKTICWYMQRRFSEIDSAALDTIGQYMSLREALVAS